MILVPAAFAPETARVAAEAGLSAIRILPLELLEFGEIIQRAHNRRIG
jgi:hypothetical protein